MSTPVHRAQRAIYMYNPSRQCMNLLNDTAHMQVSAVPARQCTGGAYHHSVQSSRVTSSRPYCLRVYGERERVCEGEWAREGEGSGRPGKDLIWKRAIWQRSGTWENSCFSPVLLPFSATTAESTLHNCPFSKHTVHDIFDPDFVAFEGFLLAFGCLSNGIGQYPRI